MASRGPSDAGKLLARSQGLRSMGKVRVQYSIMSIKVWASNLFLFVKGNVAPRRKARALEVGLLRTSTLFDPEWYRREYADVSAAGVDPAVHFLDLGWREGRDPGPEFSTSAYLRANADVAKSGKNPLIHYIEFGQFEGRETFGHRPSHEDRVVRSFDFPKPSDCFASTPSKRQRPTWLSHRDLDGSGPGACMVGGHVAGHLQDADARLALDTVVDYFEQLSSGRPLSAATVPSANFGRSIPLADAWFASAGQLRTRWQVDGSGLVLRAYQAIAGGEGTIGIVGENFIQSELDLLDLQLPNSFFPILLLFVEPTGGILGARIWAFPSLCRGGLHYCELLEANEASPEAWVDPIRHADRLLEQLGMLALGKVKPAISCISVDIEGADGSAPIFQPDVKGWLKDVWRIPVRPRAADNGRCSQFLVESVTVDPEGARGGGEGTLVLRHDMIPSLCVLAAPSDGAGVRSTLMPLLIAPRDPAQPALRLDVPFGEPALWDGNSGQLKSPRLENAHGAPRDFAAAIRIGRSDRLVEAQLFFPVGPAATLAEPFERGAITWLIEPRHWGHDQLLWAIEALFQQDGSAADNIAFIGRIPQPIAVSVDRAFPARVTQFRNFELAAAAITAEFSAYLGSGVILHDNRCSASLSRLLECDDVATASCALLSLSQMGNASHASLAWTGISWPVDQSHAVQDEQRIAEHLWGSVYPVAAPAPDFWLARSSRLKRWTGGGLRSTDAGSRHMCTAVVTASLMENGRRPGKQGLAPPVSEEGAAITKVMFG